MRSLVPFDQFAAGSILVDSIDRSPLFLRAACGRSRRASPPATLGTPRTFLSSAQRWKASTCPCACAITCSAPWTTLPR